ncbi:MAG: hypothetical protein WA517_22705 [Candidatus Acidiferrum sp.]
MGAAFGGVIIIVVGMVVIMAMAIIIAVAVLFLFLLLPLLLVLRRRVTFRFLLLRNLHPVVFSFSSCIPRTFSGLLSSRAPPSRVFDELRLTPFAL